MEYSKCNVHKPAKEAIVFPRERMTLALGIAQSLFDSDLAKARLCYDKTMAKARDITGDPEDWIDEGRVKYEAAVKKIWHIFKSNFENCCMMTDCYLNTEFNGPIEEFQKKVKVAMDELLGEVGESAKKEYKSLIDKAVEEYVLWASCISFYFPQILRKLAEDQTDTKKEQQSKKSAPKQQQKQSSSSTEAPKDQVKKTKKEMPSSSSTGEKPLKHEEKLVEWAKENQSNIKAMSQLMQLMQKQSAKQGKRKSPPGQEDLNESQHSMTDAEAKVPRMKQEREERQGSPTSKETDAGNPEDEFLPELEEIMDEEEVENQSIVGKITSNDGKGVGQPVGNLEGTMAEMLKTLKEMNDSLIAVQKKQEQQKKIFSESLKKELSELRIAVNNSVMEKLKDKNLKQ